MGRHPNALLILLVTPDDLPWRTYQEMLDAFRAEDGDGYIKIGKHDYQIYVCDSDEYSEDYQIKAKEGQVVIFDMVTYGFGQVLTWNEMLEQKQELEAWAEANKEKFRFTKWEIRVGANYW